VIENDEPSLVNKENIIDESEIINISNNTFETFIKRKNNYLKTKSLPVNLIEPDFLNPKVESFKIQSEMKNGNKSKIENIPIHIISYKTKDGKSAGSSIAILA
jgi:hypothetical protein